MHKAYIPTLDGWRALAVSLVIFAHAGDRFLEGIFYQLSRQGALGVDIFFGISGFLITHRLLEEHRDTGLWNFKRFYIRRFFRILPPYGLYLLFLGWGWQLGGLAISGKEIFSSLVFLRNYLVPTTTEFWYTGHLWSLSIEEHFYLIFPWFLAWWVPKGRTQTWLLSLIFLIAIFRYFEFRHQWIGRHFTEASFFTRTDVRLDGLLWGGVSAVWLNTKSSLLLFNQRWFGLWTLLFVSNAIMHPPFELAFRGFLTAAMLLSTVQSSGSMVFKFLETRVMIWLGRMSYSLYLWNSFFFPPREISNAFTNPYIAFASLLMVATGSYYLIERPFIRMGYRLAPGKLTGRF